MPALAINHVEHRVPGSGVPRPGSTTHEESHTDLQEYLHPLEQIHAGALHGTGIVEGLGVSAEAGSTVVAVSPGVAVDPAGRHISLAPGIRAELADKPDVISAPATVTNDGVELSTAGRSGACVVTLQWRETFDKQLLEDSFQQTFVERHTPWLRVVPVSETPAPDRLVLASLVLGADGTLAAGGLGTQGRLGLPLAAAALSLKVTGTNGASVAEAPAAALHPRQDGGLEVRTSSGGDPPLTVTGPGHIGIGTASPTALLTVDGGAQVGAVAIGGSPTGMAYDHAEQTVGAGTPTADLRLQSPMSIYFHTGGSAPAPTMHLDEQGELAVIGVARLGAGARMRGITAGTHGGAVNYAPWEYETVGVDDPTMNLRLQSPTSIYFHTGGDPAAPHASLDGAGNLSVGGNLAVAGSLTVPSTLTMQNGGTVSSTGRLHIAGDELLFLLNKSGVIVSKAWGGTGNLAVEGALTVPSTLTMQNGGTVSSTGRLHIAGDELLFLLNKSGVIVSKAWGGTGNLAVEGGMTVNGDVRLAAEDNIVYIGGNQTGPFMALHDDLWFADPQNGMIELRNANQGPGTLVGIFRNPSSGTLKEDVETLDQTAEARLLADVLSTDLVTFRYRNSPADARPRIGVIAEGCPDSIVPAGEASINPVEYAAALHGAIKELARRLGALGGA